MRNLKSEIGISIGRIKAVLEDHDATSCEIVAWNSLLFKANMYESKEAKVAQDEILIINDDETITRYLIASDGNIDEYEAIDKDGIEDNLRWYLNY